jgi:Fe2+ or Zn2+ uptake regulation protein
MACSSWSRHRSGPSWKCSNLGEALSQERYEDWRPSGAASRLGPVGPAPTLLERLRARGWRVTPQRRAVAQVLAGDHVHLTADDVLERARAVLPEVSLATVYNTLRELVDMGELLELRVGNGPARYDPNTGTAHHHLVCTVCHRLVDVHPAGLEALGLPPDQRHGYVLDEIDITFRGRCPNCVRTDTTKSRGRTRAGVT